MFITFEGVEGAGKSTQIRLLANYLRSSGYSDIVITREPGDGPLGAELRRLVLSPPQGVDVDSKAELFIMMADRAQHVAGLIKPALFRNAVVLCDRFIDSSTAYQGYGRFLDIDQIHKLNAIATSGLKPDYTILLDLDPAIGLARQKERNRMEDETLAFHIRIRNGFLELASQEPERFIVVDASTGVDEVQQAILERLKL